MIAKQIVGESFSGVVKYNEEKIIKGYGELLSTNMLGDNSKSLCNEFDTICALRPSVSKVVYHTSLSISPDEKLTNDQFIEIGEEYLKRMGFDNSQYLIYRHTDQEHPHIHLIANRITMNGEVVSDKWNYKRSEKVVRELEKTFGLKEVVSSDKTQETALSKGQIEYFKRTGQLPVKTQLQMIIKDAITKASSFEQFEASVNEKGANVLFHKNGNDKIYGVSFELDGVKFKGSSLGKAYTFNKILEAINNVHSVNKESAIGLNETSVDVKIASDNDIKKELKAIVGSVLKDSVELNQFAQILHNKGISIILHKNSLGNIFGLSFNFKNTQIKGSDLGKQFSLTSIKNQIYDNKNNQGAGLSTSRLSVSDLERASRETSIEQLEEHRGVNNGTSADNNKFENTDSSSERGVTEDESIAGGTQRSNTNWERTNFSNESHDGAHSKDVQVSEVEDISDSDISGDLNRTIDISISANLGEELDDDIEFQKKKKRRRRL